MSSFAPLLKRPAPPAPQKGPAPRPAPRPSLLRSATGWRALESQADSVGGRLGHTLAGRGDIHPRQPLPGVRRIAEGELGVGLGDVTLQADAEAERTVAAHTALAVTEGSTVRFGAGQLRTDSRGAALLGHELAHVAQQRPQGQLGLQAAMHDPSRRTDPFTPAQRSRPQAVISPPKSWAEFVAFMTDTIGVADVHVGTFEDQDGREGPGIPRRGWTDGRSGPGLGYSTARSPKPFGTSPATTAASLAFAR